MVTLSPRYSHITPILFNLHWLPVNYRIDYKIALYAFNSIYALAPKYLCDLVHVKEKSGFSLLSNDGILLLVSGGITKKSLGHRAFPVAAPRIWNGLPLEVRNEANVDRFKQLLKTHYFKLAFN